MRWLTVTLHYEKAWWDKESRSWVDEHFHILDNITLENLETRRRRKAQGRHHGEHALSSFSWNSVVFKSFRAENLKRLDLNLYFRLRLAPAKRAYRFLDKRFHRRERVELDLRDFACEKVGLSKNYDIGKIKEKLQPSIDELERVGFLEPLEKKERYVQLGAGEWRAIFLKSRPEDPAPPRKAELASLERELVSRGVTPATATGLIASHPPQRIAVKIEVFDWLLAGGDGLVLKSPAGYLVDSIRKDYVAPKGFESKVVRARRRTAEDSRRRSTSEKRSALAAREEARLEARKDPVRRYWNSLTPVEQEQLTCEALSEGDPWLVDRYEEQRESKPHLAEPFLEIIIDRFIEKHRLPPLVP
jgi:hypothetical protein